MRQTFLLWVSGGKRGLLLQRELRTLSKSKKSKAQLDRFLKTTRARACDASTLYFSEHADLWSAGFVPRDLLAGFKPKTFDVQNGTFWYFWVRPEHKRECSALKRRLKKAQWDENRWLGGRILEALDAYCELIPRRLFVLYREALATSPTDDEILARCSVLEK